MHSNGMGTVSTTAGAALAAAVDALLCTTLSELPETSIVEMMREIETSERRLAVMWNRLIVQVEERSMPQQAGVRSAVRFLEDTLRISHIEAFSRFKAAQQLGTWHEVSGRELPPLLPHTAKAQEAGEISRDHARMIGKIYTRLPHGLSPELKAEAEQLMAEHSRIGSPDDLPTIGQGIFAYVDPDGSLTDDLDRARMRGISFGHVRADGMSRISGEMTPALRAMFEPVLAKLARPGMCNPDDPHSPFADTDHVSREVLDAAAKRDSRSAAQRNHDALLAFLRPEIGPGKLGSHRGVPVSAIFTMSIAELEDAAGVVTTASGGTVSIPEALKLAERSKPFLALFDHHGMPLHLGRSKRLANSYQRMALIASERGCTRPGCNAPATLSAAHHITEHSKGGPTDIENLTLACDACHALVHDGSGGWKTIVMGEDSEFPGRTGWIAPEHIDPTGTPKVNHRHHPGEMLAAAQARRLERKRREKVCRQGLLAHRAKPFPRS
ncbi:HNH endonuclease signature motif containing protein [Nocardia jejuensis]|uniref:HNH endonuclease signature motif containing protein n=1 Tax=Nocardia jejuensis TaxID=328049 RepID=UPI0008342427|nr:HNH endonuclease signature motif containing protein [Nocardia jejuensis]